MSNPPSPTEHTRDEHPLPASTPSEQSITASTAAASTSMPGVAIAAPSLAPQFFQAPSPTGHLQSRSAAPPLSTDTQPSLQGPYGPSSNVLELSQPSSSSVRPSSSKGGRKSKAHVASACINCKKAHLSCDVNRPCARCVASGKQDTCYDVQHKKRGRPRLREEGEFKIEQMLPEARPSAVLASGVDPSARPIASTRHRRQESFRSLRSQGSDGSGVASSPNYPYPPPPTATQATFGFQYPLPPFSATPEYEIPTAYLDLDLVFLKSNAPFRQIMLAGQEVVGRPLRDIAAPVDGESFQTIRNRLRTERDARDPAYMPPIHRPGQDPLQGALIADVERYTHGFEDHIHTWTQTQLGVAAQRFPARVRLARANTYWIAITLPSFHPVGHVPAQPASFLPIQSLDPGLQTQSADRYSHSMPVAGLLPVPAAAVTLQHSVRAMGQQTASRTFPGAHVQPSYRPPQAYGTQQASFVTTPRLPVAEPPTETTAFTPRTTARELPNPSATAGRAMVQLPPLIGSPAQSGIVMTGGPPGLRPPDVTSQPTEPDEDEGADGQSRSSKRRRMGIDDVLHR